MKQDFFIVGAMKAATSTVRASLERHPDVYLNAGFETDYFADDAVFARGEDWYAARFSGRRGEAICGEGCNQYSSVARFPHAARRIAAHNPDARIVYLVRHPVERIVSDWIQRRAQGSAKAFQDPDAAVLEAPEIYVDPSFYWRQISAYRAHFPDERIFIGFMEDLETAPDETFSRICAFLGVRADLPLVRGAENRSAGKKVYGPAYSRLYRSPAVYAASRLLPHALRRRLADTLFSDRVAARPELSRAARDSFMPALRDDATRFLDHCGRPRDFWALD